jgi:hypothetical protein
MKNGAQMSSIKRTVFSSDAGTLPVKQCGSKQWIHLQHSSRERLNNGCLIPEPPAKTSIRLPLLAFLIKQLSAGHYKVFLKIRQLYFRDLALLSVFFAS